ncbi:macrolide ABC transporter ATP-binding protein [Candidatus Epulonipiscium fishelsonii]|uniref:Macrolide ABC transporter ATP-binding protein n=1 Tax=Candidatus Epulonipiscium fishelsonii TaxID=77094 RepID=A0ACC8X8N8_9FIRM|nr:macrolide ABC transporter ATP-binding protein [Epulopiscium sp. SCG-B11WGA-EpuloA1]ONI38962.1 macrolide ABC transporter ATP-binding protein [Epulopiscium sp. SCG-B05WGA-EpuloA1]ONI47486.1 macrolide ABC transporter ATP-binding protein [Epulopiscium sp. SCG-C06WGA-EpuloA1]
MIYIEHLNKIYRNGHLELQALFDVKFEVKAGEFVSIMGTSGSGKSTFLQILGCLDHSSDGTYILDGVNVSKIKQNEYSRIRNEKIGFVFQSFNLLPKLTILENVALPMMYAKVKPRERIRRGTEALEKVGLGNRLKHTPNEISGGQKQRVAIARALVNNPAILLADEPTGNLDSKSTTEIMKIFQGLNNEGVTIVMVTHEPEVAAYTKRKVVFRDGRIIEDIPIEQSIIE